MKQLRSTFLRAVAAHRALRPYGMPHRRQLVRGAGATLVLVAARLSFPWPLRGLLEIVFHNNGTGGPGEVIRLVPHRGDPAVWLIGAFVVIILVWGIAEARQRLAFTRYAVGLSRGLRDATLANLPAPRRSRGAGEVISTVTGDIARIKVGVKGILIGVSRNGAFFIGVTVIVTIIDPLVGLVFLTGGVATVVAGAIGASRSSVIIRRSRKREGVLADDRYTVATLEKYKRNHDERRRSHGRQRFTCRFQGDPSRRADHFHSPRDPGGLDVRHPDRDDP